MLLGAAAIANGAASIMFIILPMYKTNLHA